VTMGKTRDDRNLRREAKKHRIEFVSASKSSQWPSVHAVTFGNIQKIKRKTFDTYSADIDPRSNDEPWKEQTKRRAQRVASRARSLVKQDRNESGWRFSLENCILERFTIEVVW
jgi:hypothetical protein